MMKQSKALLRSQGTRDEDGPVLEACESHAVNWSTEDHGGLSFLRPSKSRDNWSRIEALRVSLEWSRVGRIKKTRHGWEWLMVTAYSTPRQAMQEIRSFGPTESGGWVARRSADYETRMRVIEFLRQNSTCCRLLFDTRSAGEGAVPIREMIDSHELRRLPKIRNRVFIL